MPNVSSALARVLTQAIAPHPQTRFPTAQLMLQALDNALDQDALDKDNALDKPATDASPTISRLSSQKAAAPIVTLPPGGTTVAPAAQPRKPAHWPIMLGWFIAATATSGLVFAIMAQSRFPLFPNPDGNQVAPALTAKSARSTISQFYQHLSNQAWDQARALSAETLADQFDPNFFQQFQRISIENLQVTDETADRIELLGQNTYFYPDRTTQRED